MRKPTLFTSYLTYILRLNKFRARKYNGLIRFEEPTHKKPKESLVNLPNPQIIRNFMVMMFGLPVVFYLSLEVLPRLLLMV